MRRQMLVTIDAPPDAVRGAAKRALGLTETSDGLEGDFIDVADASTRVHVAVVPLPRPTSAPVASRVRVEVSSHLQVPYFGGFLRGVSWLTARRLVRYAIASIEAELGEAPAPPRPRASPLLPPVRFAPDQAAQLGAVAAVGALANFGGSLLTQNGDAVTRSFHRTDDALGLALALVRVGVLVSLAASMLSDRFGRRRMILVCLVGICITNAVSAAAPSFEVFTGAQIVNRGLVNATLVVAAIAVVEEAPDGARAYAFSMFALALGLGFGISVVLLPLADFGHDGWRLAFALSALSLVAVRGVSRNLHETRRYRRLASSSTRRRGLREVFDRRYGGRFALLGAVAFLSSVFSAPSSQLTNRYLTTTRDFSNSQVALLRSITAGIPGFFGVVVAGRLSETRGRRPVMIAGLLIASVFQMAFFLGTGALLWITPAIAIVAAACAGLATGTMDAELFPTETRGSSNGFLLVCGVAGSALGLLLATRLADVVGGLGPAIALCGIAPIVAGALIVPRLPETRDRTLDELSPSEVAPDASN